MDLGTIIGLFAGIAVVIYGMMSGGDLGSYIKVSSIIVTMGGGIFATMMSFPLADSINAVKAFPLVFKKSQSSALDTVGVLVELSQKARREGLLALESAQGELKDDFLKKAMELVVDGIEAEIVKTTMQLDIDSMAVRHQNVQAYWKQLGGQFPGWGLIGTLLGLINMLKALDDPSAIGPAMALALVTTFYGAVLSNFVCSPIETKLGGNSAEEIRLREMMMEGVLSIQSGENPRLMEHKLKTFLSPDQRARYEAQNRGQDTEEDSVA